MTYKVALYGRGSYSDTGNGDLRFLDKIIEFFTRGSFTHMAIYNPVNNAMYEALLDGVFVRGVSGDEKAWVLDTDIEVGEVPNLWLMNTLTKYNNHGYDFIGAILSVFGVSMTRNGRWFCSEHVLAFIKKFTDHDLDSHKATPVDVLIQLMIKGNYTLKYGKINELFR